MITGDQLLITGGTFTSVHTSEVPIPKGLLLLLDNVAPKALHNSRQGSDSTTCHPLTRRAVLDQLQGWVSSSSHGYPVTWLHGSAGVGKTTIMHTFAELLEAQEQLLADFFFWRTADRCDTSQYLIPTLAYRICITLPEARASIVMAIERNPLIFTQKLDVQIHQLVIFPIKVALESGAVSTHRKFVLLLDGLDECQGSEQQIEVLRVLHEVTLRLPPSFMILIASRPEHHIRSQMQTRLRRGTHLLSLNDAHSVHQEIGRYFLSKFKELKQLHPLGSHIPPDWPLHGDINELVRRASGQFIYASTVVRFVSTSRKHPAQQLRIILGLTNPGSENPFRPLDSLYSAIFSKLNKDDLPATLQIVGSILICRPPIPPPIFWDRFLDLSEGEVDRLLLGLESLLSSKGGYIEVYHASLKDFLFSAARSGPYFIDLGVLSEYLAKRCIHLLFDRSMRRYILDNVVYIFSQATSTPDLQKAINLDAKFCGNLYLLDEVYTRFILALQSSV
ncbi:hypothetical protein CVT26_001741 [Gymnopilus dilepis]|uniref:NACHT domain-containing protein n=1 Tax=Gymnopilus dilepis TaxID=231916 RepID=A0A409WB47_9AGAR|nr:hypothetical protein CVT26_001741 [Gymnopilus dilepis]